MPAEGPDGLPSENPREELSLSADGTGVSGEQLEKVQARETAEEQESKEATDDDKPAEETASKQKVLDDPDVVVANAEKSESEEGQITEADPAAISEPDAEKLTEVEEKQILNEKDTHFNPDMRNPTDNELPTEKMDAHEHEEDEEDVDDSSKMDVDSEENDRREDEKLDEGTDDNETSQPDNPDDTGSSKADLPYSTRGRSSGNEAGPESWERSAREALEDLNRVKEPTTTLGASFLESLSEEERRTRTRFLPDVEGMHTLRKAEVKEDLALARSIVSGSGVTSLAASKKSKAKRARGDDDSMEVDEEDGTSPSEDDRISDVVRVGMSKIELQTTSLMVPSNAFIAPGLAERGAKDTDEGQEGQQLTLASKKSSTDGSCRVRCTVLR